MQKVNAEIDNTISALILDDLNDEKSDGYMPSLFNLE